jgi:hypothetical protein
VRVLTLFEENGLLPFYIHNFGGRGGWPCEGIAAVCMGCTIGGGGVGGSGCFGIHRILQPVPDNLQLNASSMQSHAIWTDGVRVAVLY